MSPRSSEYTGPWWADTEAIVVIYSIVVFLSFVWGTILGLVARTL